MESANKENIREAMDKKSNIRNVSVIGHYDHGKSTLMDSLVCKTGVITKDHAGETRYTDTRSDEQERCISIKSTPISMCLELNERDVALITDPELCEKNENCFLINLIDTPGHADFSSEVTAALHITDGALIVVDIVSGVCMQTEALLRQAIAERVKPILFINKLDVAIFELKLAPEELYQTIQRIVDNVNDITTTCDHDSRMGDVRVNMTDGSVGIGSGLHSWGFTVRQYDEKFYDMYDIESDVLMERIWGDNFYNEKTEEWSTHKDDDNERAFILYMLAPIYALYHCNGTRGHADQLLLSHYVKPQDTQGHDLNKGKPSRPACCTNGPALRNWLPADEALLQMIAVHSPSPIIAQKYRMEILYDSPHDDEAVVAIQNCDAEAPLMMYVSTMVPTSADKSCFYALGRVFSGRVQAGQKVHIKGPGKEDIHEVSIQELVVMKGRSVETIEGVPSGNICGVVGLERLLINNGTITNCKDAYSFKAVKPVSPLVHVAVEPQNPEDLPKLKLQKKSDPAVQCQDQVVTGVEKVHIEICLKENDNKDMIRESMDKKSNIRNVSVIGHYDHGKSTLTDSLVCKTGVITNDHAGETRYTDTRSDEQERCISIKSTPISMCLELKERDVALITDPELCDRNENSFLINLIDTPGHADFSSEVTAALHITDGALIVVDIVSGVCMQTEALLRQAIAERVKPILFINKLDVAILELKLDPEELYQTIQRIVDNVNDIIDTCDHDSRMGDVRVNMTDGSVGIGSGLHSWGFTVRQYAEKFYFMYDIESDVLMERIWGDNFYNEQTKEWSTQKDDDNERASILYMLAPIHKLYGYIADGLLGHADQHTLWAGSGVSSCYVEVQGVHGHDLYRAYMRNWLPADEALLQMIAVHLPSPIIAQKYRMEILYDGPHDDEAAVAIQNCDAEAPLMMYVSTMVPTLLMDADKSCFYALGRVFSGRVQAGQKVHIMGTSKEDIHEESIQELVVMKGRSVESAEGVPSGNICGVVGLDRLLNNNGTITTCKDAYSFKAVKPVSPLVHVAVKPQNPEDLPKLLAGLKLLEKSDPAVQCEGQVVAGVGELHLDICLKDLEENYACIPINKSEPYVSHRESVAIESEQMCMAKSPNGLNCLYMKAKPMPDGLLQDIDEGRITPTEDSGTRARYLHDKYKYNIDEARNIWSFGPDGIGPNILVDCSKGVQYLEEIKAAIVSAFQSVTKQGPLAAERMRGVQFSLYDVTLHEDANCREADEIIEMTRRCLYACILTAIPQLLEPYYLCDIQCPVEIVGSIYGIMNRRRGNIFNETAIAGTPLALVEAHLPVVESFGYDADVRRYTEGQAVSQSVFHKWMGLPGDPMMEYSRPYNVIQEIRNRKGLKEGVPDVSDYLDEL